MNEPTRSTVLAAVAVLGYLLGTIPFGLLLTRAAGLGDIRRIGSGNIGATNVLRTGNKKLALATLLLDGVKGAVAAVAGLHIAGAEGVFLAGLGAVLGHLFPIWLGFRGGKGVATFFGILLAIAWPVGVLAGATWIAIAVLFRISSLAALTAAALAPLYAFAVHAGYPVIALSLFMSVFIFIRHRQNIARLLKGDEPRIGGKAKPPAEPA